MRRRTMRQHNLAHERVEVDLVFRKILDMPLARIRQLPGGMPLSPPVHGRNRKAAPAEIVDRLEIFLDELAASPEDTDRSLTRRRIPARETQLHAIRRSDLAVDRPFGNR